MKKNLLIAFCLGLVQTISAQMTVTSNLTVEQYIQDVLLGVNVTVSNITFNGGSAAASNVAIGGFEAENSNLGIPSGFVMTSGAAEGVVGPNNQTSYTGVGADAWFGDDPDLLDLVQANGGTSVNDWAIIEFDFVPLGDTLRFNYVWGSDEYDFYAESAFNDVFGFFISGPGITGPYSNNAQNIALLPDGVTPVGINTINNGSGNAGPCDNCDLYNQQSDADMNFPWPIDPDADWFNDPYYMQYDGYTDILTAVAIVQCGLTYHIKLAICDANDTSLDSGIFLQRDSFSSNLVVQATLNLDVAGPDGHTMFENCGDGYLVFERPASGNPNTELIAYLGYSGTAINGVDFTLLPDSVVFEPGVMSVSVFIDAFADGIAEGGETVQIEIENIADCGETLLSSSFEFVIQDIAEPLVVAGMDYEICSGETQTLEPVITGGYAVYHFDWSTGETTETIDVTPGNTTTYFLTVSDTCGMPSDDAQFVVNVLLVPVMTVDLEDTDNILPLECEEFGNVYATVTGGIAPYNYSYTDDQGNNLWGMENTVGISSWSAGMIYVDITDECGFTATDSLFIEVNAPPLFVTLDAPTTVGCNEAFTATANANGGYLSWGYSYQWWLNGSPDWSSWTEILNGIATEANNLVEVSVTDNCGQTVSAQANITTLSPPITITLPEQNVGNCNTVFTITPDIEGGSGGLGSWTYAWSANGGIIGNNQVLTTSFDETTNVSLSAFDMCGVEGNADLTVEIENPEITIDLGEDISTSCISNTTLTANYEGGSGGVTFQWLNNGTPAGTLQTLSVQTFETIDIAINVLDACGQSASDVVSIIIPQNPIEMTLAQEQHICPGDSASIWALASGGEGGFGYNWSNGVNQPSFTDYPAVSTNYIVTATDICGKSITGNVLVGVHPVVANFTATKLEDNVYEFINTSTPEEEITEVVWNFGDGDTDYSWNSQHVYDGMQEYTATLHVTNVLGCTDEGSYAIMPAPIIYIPSAFTPNADGLNDVWKIEGRAIREFELKIFNRWGALVYASTDPEDVWVGDQGGTGEYYVQNNVYNYILRVKGYDGETITKKGTITMMR